MEKFRDSRFITLKKQIEECNIIIRDWKVLDTDKDTKVNGLFKAHAMRHTIIHTARRYYPCIDWVKYAR